MCPTSERCGSSRQKTGKSYGITRGNCVGLQIQRARAHPANRMPPVAFPGARWTVRLLLHRVHKLGKILPADLLFRVRDLEELLVDPLKAILWE